MKKVSLLLVGGMKQEKAEKVIVTLTEELKKREIQADVIYANLFDSADLSQYEDKCDLVVHAGTGKIDTNLKVVQGLGLLYPYMGTEPIYDEIQKIVSEESRRTLWTRFFEKT